MSYRERQQDHSHQAEALSILTSRMRDHAEKLLEKYGTVEKDKNALRRLARLVINLGRTGLINSKVFSVDLDSTGGPFKVTMRSNRADPSSSEWIFIKPEVSIEGLVLQNQGEALIFEDWGMGEKISELKENVEESISATEVVEYTNPRAALSEEIEPYKRIVETILQKYPVN